MKPILIVLTLLLSAATVSAQEEAAKPDYSPDALREFVVEGDLERDPPRSPFDLGLIFLDTDRLRIRWMPFVAPLLLSQTSGSPDITTNPIVDPFTLNRMSFPSTPGQARDRFRDWRERRTLRKFVAAANAADRGN